MFSSILSFHDLPIASAGLSWKSYVALVLIVFCDNTAWIAWTKDPKLLSKIKVSWTEWSWIGAPSRSWREHFRDEAPGSDVLSRRCRKMIGVGTTTQVAPPSEPGRPISGTRLSSWWLLQRRSASHSMRLFYGEQANRGEVCQHAF